MDKLTLTSTILFAVLLALAHLSGLVSLLLAAQIHSDLDLISNSKGHLNDPLWLLKVTLLALGLATLLTSSLALTFLRPWIGLHNALLRLKVTKSLQGHSGGHYRRASNLQLDNSLKGIKAFKYDEDNDKDESTNHMSSSSLTSGCFTAIFVTLAAAQAFTIWFLSTTATAYTTHYATSVMPKCNKADDVACKVDYDTCQYDGHDNVFLGECRLYETLSDPWIVPAFEVSLAVLALTELYVAIVLILHEVMAKNATKRSKVTCGNTAEVESPRPRPQEVNNHFATISKRGRATSVSAAMQAKPRGDDLDLDRRSKEDGDLRDETLYESLSHSFSFTGANNNNFPDVEDGGNEDEVFLVDQGSLSSKLPLAELVPIRVKKHEARTRGSVGNGGLDLKRLSSFGNLKVDDVMTAPSAPTAEEESSTSFGSTTRTKVVFSSPFRGIDI